MLDLTRVARQMQGISKHLAQEAVASRARLERAQTLMAEAIMSQSVLIERGQDWRDRLIFTAATPLEPLDTQIEVASPPTQQTIVATDGSQIAPSHHEIAYCYLLNTGRVVLHYGQSRHPLLDSLPEVFYRAEDLYGARRWGIRTEEWMGYRRTVAEIETLADLVEQEVQPVRPVQPAQPTTPLEDERSRHPGLALVDGSLIYWFLDSLPREAVSCILPPILEAWERLRSFQIPLVGYVSASRSSESLNFLRLQSCPYDFPDCVAHCENRNREPRHSSPPCQVFAPLRDVTLWSTQLEPGQRGPLWRSSAKILDAYGTSQAIHFCYLHVGAEIARIEFPAWVATDKALLDSALSLILSQVQKGYGYPVALAEAHNQAVVRGGDRKRFFAMLERQMVRAGLRNVGTSYKEARKRGSIA